MKKLPIQRHKNIWKKTSRWRF